MRPLDPRTTALLVMDLQPGIVARVAEGEALVGRVAGVLDVVRSAGAQVAYVRVGLTDADHDSVPAHHAFARTLADPAARAALHADSPTTQVDARVAPRPGDVVVRKTRVGPFTSTDLAARLRQRGVEALVLTGLSTSGVVLSTVRQAADLDFRVVVLSDCCADADADVEVHDLLTGRVFPRQADVVTAAELRFAE